MVFIVVYILKSFMDLSFKEKTINIFNCLSFERFVVFYFYFILVSLSFGACLR